jgi:hypothetical protein
VTLTDVRGVRHSVDVTAESVFEAALALEAMRRSPWLDVTARASMLEVVVLEPVVKHQVSVEQVEAGTCLNEQGWPVGSRSADERNDCWRRCSTIGT